MVGAALLTISSGVFLCGSVTCKEMVRYTFYVGVALWRGSNPTAGGSTPNAWSISRGRRSAFDHVLWCFAVCLCPLQRHGSIHLVHVTGVAFWRGSKPNARGSKPKAWSISRGRRSTLSLSLAKKWFDIKPSMYT